jgi:hypothetical protein
VVNEINMRKVGAGEHNVFEGMFRNWLFVVILLFIAGLQVHSLPFISLPSILLLFLPFRRSSLSSADS